jgi:hypothetical protein
VEDRRGAVGVRTHAVEVQETRAGPSGAVSAGGQYTACAGTSTVRPVPRSSDAAQAIRMASAPGAAPRISGPRTSVPLARSATALASAATRGRSAPHSSAASRSAPVAASSRDSPLPFETWSTWPPGRMALATSTPVRSSPVTRATRVTESARARAARRSSRRGPGPEDMIGYISCPAR